MKKELIIRNSTMEFLTFILDGQEEGVQVLYKDETIWATQKAMSTLFECSSDNIGVHLRNIFNSNELNKEATTEKISVVQTEGDREVNQPHRKRLQKYPQEQYTIMRKAARETVGL